MTKSPWRARASRVIATAIADGRARGLDGEALVAHVDAAYPFGPRANHPYQIWLSERRSQLVAEGLMDRPHAAISAPAAKSPASLPLFPEDA